jgi:hypothetical protein
MIVHSLSLASIGPAVRRALLAFLALLCSGLLLPPAFSMQDTQQTPPQTEGFTWGPYQGRSEIEIGYRWVSTAGNKDMYRSMVNLGEGPKLLRSDLSLRSGYTGSGLFDTLDLSLNSWGGDPYNSLRLHLARSGIYDFRASYRNLNYYNFIPSFANPLLAQGLTLGQHSINNTSRVTDIQLDLFPNNKIHPFFGYSRVSTFGSAFSTYSLTGNEFLLRADTRFASDEYRGGLQFDYPAFNLTLEQGYRLSRNDSARSDASVPDGNNPVPFIGLPVTLNSLQRSYRDRTSAPISKILAKYRPFRQLSITGRYVYSVADLDSTMAELSAGNLISLENRIVYASAAEAFTGRATRPRHLGNLLAEFSLLPHLKIIDRLDTRNYHVSGSALLDSSFYDASSLAGPTPPVGQITTSQNPSDLLVYDSFANQTEAEFDLTGSLMARAGYRYKSTEVTLGDTPADSSRVKARQDTAIFGFYYRQARWLHLSFAYEYNWTDHALTRTDLLDYGQFNFEYRVGPWKNLSLNGRLTLLANENRASDINLSSRYRNYSVALNYEWNQRLSLALDYGRFTYSSDIGIIIPQFFTPASTLYQEHTDAVGAALGFNLYHGSRLDFGYRGILSTGNLPLNYHQPWATFLLPFPAHFALKTYWQYYGYNEKTSSLQDYRGHLVTVGIVYRY